MAKLDVKKTHIEKLKQQRRVVGMLQFKYKEDQNFSKWYSLTENLVIRAFGAKSNQISQLNDLYGDMLSTSDGDYLSGHRLQTKEAKEKMKDIMSVFISELELDLEEDATSQSTRGGNISIRMQNDQTINQTVNISSVIKNVIENIKQIETDPQRVVESEQKLRELENEIQSKSPTWSKVKDILIWLLNFGRDAFIQVLPIILEKYKQ